MKKEDTYLSFIAKVKDTVGIYTISSKLPKDLRKYLPDEKTLQKHLDKKSNI